MGRFSYLNSFSLDTSLCHSVATNCGRFLKNLLDKKRKQINRFKNTIKRSLFKSETDTNIIVPKYNCVQQRRILTTSRECIENRKTVEPISLTVSWCVQRMRVAGVRKHLYEYGICFLCVNSNYLHSCTTRERKNELQKSQYLGLYNVIIVSRRYRRLALICTTIF